MRKSWSVTTRLTLIHLAQTDSNTWKLACSTGSLSSFNDGSAVSDWATPAMEWAVGAGILGGKDGNVIDPTGTATRAEIAAILNRFIAKY